MSHATSVVDAVADPVAPRAATHSPILFQSLILTEPESHQGRKSATFFISIVLHSALVVAVAIVPLLYYDAMPSQEALKAFLSGYRPVPTPTIAAPGLSLHGQMRAIDFQVHQGGRVVAGPNTATIATDWTAAG